MACEQRTVKRAGWGYGLVIAGVLGSGWGCTGGSKAPQIPVYKGDTVPVSGTVTLDGQPLADALVTFVFDGQAPPNFTGSGGRTDSMGKYVVRSGGKEGTPPGRYKVVISRLATPDGAPFRENPEQGLDLEQARLSGMVKESVPPKYSDPEKTILSVEITANQKDPVNFDLKSK